METNLTTEQKIKILSSDFLDRDPGTLVKSRKDGRLNWESTIREGGSYSEFVLHPESDEDLLKNAVGLAGDMIKVMDAKQKVNIRIAPDNSCTDASTVWVATKVFDDPDLTVGQKLDTFIGLAVHEGCHLLYTSFGQPFTSRNATIRALQNIIEDERIERECGQSRPGLSNFLAASKYYYFDKYRQVLRKQGCLESLDTAKRLMNAVLSYIRYPKALEETDVREFCDILLKVREELMPYPTSTAESLEAAIRIYASMQKYFEEQEQQKQQEKKEQKQQKNEDNKPEGKGSSSETGMDKSISQMQEAMDSLSRMAGKAALSEADVSDTVKREGGKVGLVCEGRLERGTQRNTFVEKASGDKGVYSDACDRIKRYIPCVSRSLRCLSSEYRLDMHGMRSGDLDTGKLVEALQGVPGVYIRHGEVRADRIAVCILIDESGSMWGAGEKAARDTAVLLNEAIGSICNIDLYIYGHTASREATSLFVYREKGLKNRYALGSTQSRAGNHDSIAIREAAARVRRHTADKCLFFVISDGAPNESVAIVRKAVKDVCRDNFSIVAVSIDPYYDPSTMYDNNLTFTDMQALASELGKVVSKAIMKTCKKSVG